MKNYAIILVFAIIGCLSFNCTSEIDKDENLPEVEAINDASIEKQIDKAINIFKHLYLPTEMSKIFQDIKVDYNPELTNPVSNTANYVVSSDKALNMGVYGVDLGYVRMYNKRQNALDYIYSVQSLSEYLGIPDSYFSEALDKFDKPVTNKDSLVDMANSIYISTDKFLRENNQERASAMIILGGWIEAMYIAFKLSEEEPVSFELINRIAAQKGSLSSLTQLFSVYNDSPLICDYHNKLLKLKEEYDGITIEFNKPYTDLDSLNSLISSNEFYAEINLEQLQQIKQMIYDMRTEIVF